MVTSIDLFCGAGGLTLGLKKNDIKCVLAVEYKKDFAETFCLNNSNSKIITEDISTVDFSKILKENNLKDIDLVCGGPPCQGFSTVGKKNAEDKRNSLFWQFLRAVDEVDPKIVLFENVSGFKRLYKGVAYHTLVNELKKKGYNIKSEILDAANFGAPQHRKRTIVIGFKKNLKFNFPKITHTETETLITKKFVTLKDAISDLPKLDVNDSKNQYMESNSEYQKLMRNGQNFLSEHNSSNYGKKMQNIMSLIPKDGSVNDLPKHLQPKNFFGNTYARLNYEVPAPTITRNFGTPSSSRCIHPDQNRALSTREGARIQGFPDSYKFIGSKTSKNLQIGNAVPIALGEALGKEIYLTLKSY
tara:strand:+ start:1806 stop:2882 length:1077 start_codon:yes stop_codon:yes gene_type:complete